MQVQPVMRTTDVYGGFWLRCGAYLIDNLILFVPSFVIQFLSNMTFGAERGPLVGVVMSMFLGFFYFGLLQAQMEGSFGKRIMGLRLVGPTYERLTLGQTTLRYVVHFASAMVLCLGYLWVSWDEKKRAWHDLACGSQVVKKEYLEQVRGQMQQSQALLPAPGSSDLRAA